MGRLVKNLKLTSGSYAIRLPQGSDTLLPDHPEDGQIRYNISASNMEVFYGGTWKGVGLVGRAPIDVDSYTGNGLLVDYAITNLYQPGHEAELIVFIGGVYQIPGVAYTVNQYTLTFTSPPNLGLPIIILENFNSTHVQ